jgi:ERCC4-type nuclease
MDLRAPSFINLFGGMGVVVPQMYAGDAAFFNKDGTRAVCVEVKTPRDLAECLENTGRLVQQMKNAREYGYVLYCLIVQGLYRDREGYACTLRRGGRVRLETAGGKLVQYQNLTNFLTTLEMVEGVLVKRTEDDNDTAAEIVALYHWWQKDVEDHTSTSRFYTPTLMPVLRHSALRRMVKELAGVSIERSGEIDRHFGASMERLMAASEKELLEVPGVGKVTARSIWTELHGKGEA